MPSANSGQKIDTDALFEILLECLSDARATVFAWRMDDPAAYLAALE